MMKGTEMMAFELTEPATLSICADCVYFNAYGRLDDQAMDADRNAAEKHKARIARRQWPWGTEFTPGCGSTCDEHGIASIDFTDEDEWLEENDGTTADYEEAREEAWRASMEDVELEPWFSWSACGQCGSTLGGDREHATAWTWKDGTDEIPAEPRTIPEPEPVKPAPAPNALNYQFRLRMVRQDAPMEKEMRVWYREQDEAFRLLVVTKWFPESVSWSVTESDTPVIVPFDCKYNSPGSWVSSLKAVAEVLSSHPYTTLLGNALVTVIAQYGHRGKLGDGSAPASRD